VWGSRGVDPRPVSQSECSLSASTCDPGPLQWKRTRLARYLKRPDKPAQEKLYLEGEVRGRGSNLKERSQETRRCTAPRPELAETGAPDRRNRAEVTERTGTGREGVARVRPYLQARSSTLSELSWAAIPTRAGSKVALWPRKGAFKAVSAHRAPGTGN